MKTFAVPLLLATVTLAFPHLDNVAHTKRESGPYSMPPQGKGADPSTPPPFDAKSQFVSTSGTHAWKAPGPNDSRGPCPGLNAAANHNYLPRNGYATIPQFIQGTHDAFGMSTDLSTVLAVFGAVADGNLLGWSIGGAQHTGISGSHGNYETDGSVVHGDMNQYGSTNKFIMAQFKRLYAMQPHAATANYNLEVLRAFRATRFTDSIAMNPYYFYGIFPGLTVSMAAHAFIYRLMANKSAEYPEGILSRETLKSFMAVSGPDDNLVHTPGHERIPSPFYRRNDADLYSLFGLNADTQYFGKTVPQLTDFGCNQGRVNSFSTYSIAELTGGAYADGAAVLKNPLCFAGATLQATAGSLLGINGAALELLNTVLSPIVGDCPAITHPNFSQLQQCPGFTLYGGPTGYVAPGAIQEK